MIKQDLTRRKFQYQILKQFLYTTDKKTKYQTFLIKNKFQMKTYIRLFC